MYEFLYDYVKTKYKKTRTMLCGHMFYCLGKTDDKYIYKDIAEDVEARPDTSNYELDRPLTKEKKSNTINEI